MHLFLQDQIALILYWAVAQSLKSLQLTQNAAARVLMRTDSRARISPVLASLHRLPVRFRIEFKILLLTYKALSDRTPSYLKDLIVRYFPNRAQLQVYLLFPEFLKVEWEAEPSVIRPLSCGISCQ